MLDTVPACDITPPEGTDVLDLKPGDCCQASYESRYYSVKVVATGKIACTPYHILYVYMYAQRCLRTFAYGLHTKADTSYM